MNKIKEFVINNKILTGFISIAVFIAIVTVIVIMTSMKNSNHKEKQSNTIFATQDNIKVTTDKSTSESTTTENNASETDSSVTAEPETTTQETVVEETTTTLYVPIDLPYLIKINRIENCITVYSKDSNGEYTVPFKAITVSCGKIIDDTPLGTFGTVEYYVWGMMFDGSYAQYAYRIVDSILFHSVPYIARSNNTLDWQEYNKLGTSASHGCVRMTVADAKWLVDNCPIGTTVIIYDEPGNPGPLGKPDTIKIPENSPYKDWDPTDPNPNNPWHQYNAKIMYNGNGNITLVAGSTKEDLLKYFNAIDTCGNDITHKIEFLGEYNLNEVGTYTVMARVIDAIGNKAEIMVNVVVNEKETTTIMQPSTTVPPTTVKETTVQETTPVQQTTTQPTQTTTTATAEQTTTHKDTEEETTSPQETTSQEKTTSEQETTSNEETTSEQETTSL